METILIYLGKSLFLTAIFWFYYVLFLRGKEFHKYNRFYLLSAVLASLILPIIKVDWFTIEPNNQNLFLLLSYLNGNEVSTAAEVQSSFSYWQIVGVILGLIAIFFLLKYCLAIFRIKKIKNQFPNEKFDEFTLVNTTLEAAPFTFWRDLFWNQNLDINSINGRRIFKHELTHITQKHSRDRVLMQVCTAVFWFNPFYHLMSKELSLIHEYLADQAAIGKKDSKAFAEMLLSTHFLGQPLAATSPFYNSTIKKRLKMISQNHKTKFSYARRLWALPLLFLLSFAYLVQAKNKEIKVQDEVIANTLAQVSPQVYPENDSIKRLIEKRQREIEKRQLEMEHEQEEIEILSKEIEKKSKELKRLKVDDNAQNNQKIDKKIEEIDHLMAQIDKKLKKPNWTVDVGSFKISPNQWFHGGDIAYGFTPDESIAHWEEMEEYGKELEIHFDELSKHSEAVRKSFEKMEFEFPDRFYIKGDTIEIIKDFSKGDFDFEFGFDLDSLIDKSLENIEIEIDNIEIEDMEELTKEIENARKELKKAEIEMKKADKAMKNAEKANNFQIESDGVIISENKGKNLTIKGDLVKIVGGENDKNTKFFLNGKEISKEEMEKINPDDIESVSVFKNNKENNENKSEIRIKTKK